MNEAAVAFSDVARTPGPGSVVRSHGRPQRLVLLTPLIPTTRTPDAEAHAPPLGWPLLMAVEPWTRQTRAVPTQLRPRGGKTRSPRRARSLRRACAMPQEGASCGDCSLPMRDTNWKGGSKRWPQWNQQDQGAASGSHGFPGPPGAHFSINNSPGKGTLSLPLGTAGR